MEIGVFVGEYCARATEQPVPTLMITKRLWLLSNDEVSRKWENDFIAKRFLQQRYEIVVHTKNDAHLISGSNVYIVSVQYTMCTTHQFDDFQVAPHQTLVYNIFF